MYEELQLDENDEESKTKMIEILKRVNGENTASASVECEELDSDDDEECDDLGLRLAGIDLNDAGKVWDQLTSDEKQEFEAFLR